MFSRDLFIPMLGSINDAIAKNKVNLKYIKSDLYCMWLPI